MPSFFRKAFHKIAGSHDNNELASSLKASPSTAAAPSLSYPNDFGVALWDGTARRQTTVVPLTLSNSDSSRSPSSKFSLADKDSAFKPDDALPLPLPKLPSTPRSYHSDLMPYDDLQRHRTPKKPSTPSFPRSLANLAGLQISSRNNPDDSDLSDPLPTPEPLSSTASTPNSIPPPPPSHGRRRRRPQNIETLVHPATLPSYFSYDTTPSTAVDPTVTKRLEEIANRARVNAAMTSESSISVNIPEETTPSRPSRPVVHEDPSTRVEPIQNDIEQIRARVKRSPPPDDLPVRSIQNNLDYQPSTISLNESPMILQEPLYSNTTLALNGDLNHILERTNSNKESIHSQDDKAEPPTSDPVAESDYSSSLIDNYLNSSMTPPPLPSFSFDRQQQDSNTQQLEEELCSLRSRLAESKARIDALSEEKSHMNESHRRDIIMLLDTLDKSQQKEAGYLSQIMDLVSEKERIKADRDDIVQQLKSQIEDHEKLEKENKELQQESVAFRDFKSKVRDNEVEYERLFKEKDSWQGQIDSMHQRLSDAERRVRCLDAVTRHKYQAKQDGAYGSAVGRSTKLHFSPHVKGPSMDVITSVTVFNEEVLQTASFIVEHLEETESKSTGFSMSTDVVTARAREIWGSRVVGMLQERSSQLNILLLKNCLEVFMTHWCVHIVEGWYPKQPSFSDILVELTSQPGPVSYHGKQQVCGKQIKIVSTDAPTPDFTNWVKDVVQDLTSILTIGGVRMPVLKTTLLPDKIEPVLKLAHHLRLALAERDICGGLEIAAPSPDVPFHPQFMEDAEESAVHKSRKRKVSSSAGGTAAAASSGLNWLDGEYIAGTNGLGLKRTLNGQPGVYEMVVKPKVSLIRVLETVF